ncbi:hypothetical protein [Limnoglobus roseus]|uniref:hypothetical protein n=1 Tax=Limnoglobus roseus TaxID=2598579 RepID=UPI0011EB354C|nr:hypothetical protein [Limnoglobus roseus]
MADSNHEANQDASCRAAFEQWAAQVNPVSGLEGALKRKPNGEYLWSGTTLAWQAWQAGWDAAEAKGLAA